MLRPATVDDVSYIQSVLNKPDNHDKLADYPDDAIANAIDDPEHWVFIWTVDDKAHGFCWSRNTDRGVKIEEFGVSTPGLGVGSSMFAALLDWATSAPQPLWLMVAGDNDGAIRFYERYNFVRTGFEPAVWHRRSGPVADAVTMEWQPPAPAQT